MVQRSALVSLPKVDSPMLGMPSLSIKPVNPNPELRHDADRTITRLFGAVSIDFIRQRRVVTCMPEALRCHQ